jgi:hypothetical protein
LNQNNNIKTETTESQGLDLYVCRFCYEEAHIVHYNGKCDVKYGDIETIATMKDKLRSAGLSATMEANN